MHQVSLSEFRDAVETLGLLSLSSREDVRKKYLKLSRIYHPDMENGSTKKFQEINDAYEILTNYMDSFRFVFDDEEFKRQNPILVSAFNQEWIKGGNG
jgi:DnaJ-class molecular chaperone